jgi:hypothetical protein
MIQTECQEADTEASLVPRPQFTLKVILIWLMLLPAAFGAFVAFSRSGGFDGKTPVPFIPLAGALCGACIGSYKSFDHAARCALLGSLLAWPVYIIGLLVLSAY